MKFNNFKPSATNNTNSLTNCTLVTASSLKNKLADLHFIMYNGNVHIIIITESWLHEGITDGLLDSQGLFNVFSSDRTHGRGGGVCVLISNCLPVIAKHSNLLSDFIVDTNTAVSDDRVYRPDIVCIEPVSLFRIIAVYRPPSNNTALLPSHTGLLTQHTLFSNKLPTVNVGDFNCPDIDWTNLQSPSDGQYPKPYISILYI